MCNWKVIYYKTNSGRVPVVEYIQSQEVERASNISNAIRLLREFGIGESLLDSRKLTGKPYRGLYELRVNSSRIIYFLHIGREFVLLHGFTKQKNKTPKTELEKAKQRMKKFLR